MDEQSRFRTALSALLASAENQNRKLTKEEIQTFFRDMDLNEEQRPLVYAYLASKKIQAEGAEPLQTEAKEESYTAEEQEFLKQYQKDMRLAVKQPGEHLEELVSRASEGHEKSKRLLTEHCMDLVLPAAKAYIRQGLPLQDLVQEGNLGLMIGVDTLGLKDEEISWKEYLESEICRAIRGALDMQAGSDHTGEQIAEKLNRLADSITELTEEMGRQVTPEELSLFLNMPIEELEDLLRIAGEQIEMADGK